MQALRAVQLQLALEKLEYTLTGLDDDVDC